MSGAPVRFQARTSIEQVEEGHDLAPKFDDRGLITVVTTDADSGELLMQGYMNSEALRLTITTGEAHYYSRSRKTLWHNRRRELPCRLSQLLLPQSSGWQ
jgi:phosphoribosyl-AMP cyclohydrolase